MKAEELEDFTWHSSIDSYLNILAKAILLDKVSIGNNPIKVKAFKEDEI